MLKSLPNMLNRNNRKDENIKNFNKYLEDIKLEFLKLEKLIEDYKLDDTKLLPPQIERYLDRSLTTDEKVTIEFASRSMRVGGYQKTGTIHHHKKKKKKK